MVHQLDSAADLARRLGANAEAVCRHYLSNGRRAGRYWLVGDVLNSPGRSLYVRLIPSADGRRRAGKWTDAATGEHGDLLDIIAFTEGLHDMRRVLDEARRFLSLPRASNPGYQARGTRAPTGSREAARRLFAASGPIAATLAERYLRARSLGGCRDLAALRFHPRCLYARDDEDPPDTPGAWPALVAAVTDENGALTGIQRCWIDPDSLDKAPLASPRRAMGDLLGHGVRFGAAGPVMASGEGIETMLSLRRILPAMPMIAGLSANHLAAIRFPAGLDCLYIARDNDPSGRRAQAILSARAEAAKIETRLLEPLLEDFNGDLKALDIRQFGDRIRGQLRPEDRDRYLAFSGCS